jgi:hypothetical protein
MSDETSKALAQRLHNMLGRQCVHGLSPDCFGFLRYSLEVLTAGRACRILLALRLYTVRKGQLPAGLADLVGEGLLPAVPIDPFSERPFRYSRERALLWSVGPDGRDDGGPKPEGLWRGKDYVWRVPPLKEARQ